MAHQATTAGPVFGGKENPYAPQASSENLLRVSIPTRPEIRCGHFRKRVVGTLLPEKVMGAFGTNVLTRMMMLLLAATLHELNFPP